MKSKKGNNFTALYHWTNTHSFTQSDKIKCGLYVQTMMSKLTDNSPLSAKTFPLKNVLVNGKKKEIDLIFKLNNVIHYFEIKCNVSLDSEKAPATQSKIDNIVSSLKLECPNYPIQGHLLCPAHLDSISTSSFHIQGLNSFLKLLGYPELTPQQHIGMGENLGLMYKAANNINEINE